MKARQSSKRCGRLVAVGIISVGVALSGCQSTGTSLPMTSGASLAFVLPSPLAGPGRPTLDPRERENLGNAWMSLVAGRLTEVPRTVGRFASPQASLLALQAALAMQPSDDLLAKAATLVEKNPDYAAAWITLSIAAEMSGDERTAYDAALRGDELWPSGPLAGRAGELERRFVGDRLDRGRAQLEADHPTQAIAAADKVLTVDAANPDALLLRGRALIALDRTDEALDSLARLGLRPEALLLRADVASRRGDWQQAMNLLGSLPEKWPGKERALRRAQLNWRLSVLPDDVREATTSSAVTRAQLATILLAVIPALEVQEGGTTPLMTDIIDLPSQRAILTATRLDIMDADRVAKLFHPSRPATAAETRAAIDAVCHLMGMKAPLWCDPGMEDGSCEKLTEPVSGPEILEILLAMEAESRTAT